MREDRASSGHACRPAEHTVDMHNMPAFSDSIQSLSGDLIIVTQELSWLSHLRAGKLHTAV